MHVDTNPRTMPSATSLVLASVAVLIAILLCRRDVTMRLHSLLSARNGSLTEPLKQRVKAGVIAFEQGLVSHLIFSGAHPGSGVRGTTEANAMVTYAMSIAQASPLQGRWILEEESTSTRTNANYSLDIVRDHGWRSVVIITSPFHQLRSLWTFTALVRQRRWQPLGMMIYVAPVPLVGHAGYGKPLLDNIMDHVDFWRELAAIVYYKIKGFI